MTRHPAAPFAAVLLILCFALQVQTAGWGSLYNETDGQYAGAARVMADGGDWLIPENNGVPRLVKPPLLYWLIAASFRTFGVNEFAARLPNALGVTAWVFATFLIGLHLAGPWRGFLSGVVLLTCLGTGTLARIVMPEPVFCAFLTLAIYCGLRGLGAAALRSSRLWTLTFWLLAALAVFTKGLHGLLYPLLIVGVSGLLGKAPVRRLISPLGIGIFLAITVPWHVVIEIRFPGILANLFIAEHLGHIAGSDSPATNYTAVPRWQFLLLHVAWLFPWSVIALTEGIRRLRRGPAVDRGNATRTNWALLATWGLVVVIPVLLAGQRQDYYAMAAWPAFALAVAALLGNGISWASLAAFAATVAAALVILSSEPTTATSAVSVAERSTAWTTLTGLDATIWASLATIGRLALGGALAALALAAILRARGKPVLALRPVLLAAACVSFGAMAGYARVAPYFSVAGMAPVLRSLGDQGIPIAFDGGIDTGSSLLFYGTSPVLLIDQDPAGDFITRTFGTGRDRYLSATDLPQRWRDGGALALVTEESRIAFWRERLPDLGDPATRSGTQVIFLRPAPEDWSSSQ